MIWNDQIVVTNALLNGMRSTMRNYLGSNLVGRFGRCVLLLCIISASGCIQGSVRPSEKDKSANEKIPTEPIKIKGVSLGQSRKEVQATIVKTVGCVFGEKHISPEKQMQCCMKPRVRPDGSDYCAGRSAIVGLSMSENWSIEFSCEAYSGCQYSASEVIKILSQKYNLKFSHPDIRMTRDSCAVSQLEEMVCVGRSFSSQRTEYARGEFWAPSIELSRHKERKIDL